MCKVEKKIYIYKTCVGEGDEEDEKKRWRRWRERER